MNNKIFETKEEASIAYYKYVTDHINNVHIAWAQFGIQLCQYLESKRENISASELYMSVHSRVFIHDKSKFSKEEYIPYVQKFYPWKDMDKTQEQIAEEFDDAWTHHIKHNDHHPEHWLQYSELRKKNISVTMDNAAIVEMLLDWIAMSLARNQSMYEWWRANDGGRKEKSKIMNKSDFEIVDNWIEENRELIDFTRNNNNN